MRKTTLAALAAGVAIALASQPTLAADKLKIGFLPGVVDPFYQVMQLGVEKAAKDLGAEVARGDLNYIIIAPVDKDQMVGPLKTAADHGIKIITVDTYLGDGDYVKGPVKFPLSYIGSDNIEGGRIAARGLAKAIGGKGSVYINSTNPNVSSVEGRAVGFKEVMAK
jgi:ribose transport system substrate-binding protein